MRLIRTLERVAALTFVASGSLVAQETVAPPASPTKNGKAEISGLVIDSLNRRYLRGADVIIEGANANLVTDSAGRFRLDGLPPGTYQVDVFHPLLDTLGISLSSRPFRVGPDSTGTVILSVPSAATIIRGACPPRSGDQGNSAVIGRVEDSEALQPVAGAEVSIAWMEIEVSKQVGIRQTPHVLRDTTNAFGAFRICGVPSSMDATLQARKAKAATSGIPISLGDADSQLLARTLLLSRADSVATAGNPTALGDATVSGNSSVSGIVVLDGSATNEGSRVELVGTDVVVLTNKKGEFTMTNLPSGSRILLTRHLGYGAQLVPVDLTPRQPQKVSVTLPKFVAIMDPVLVTARLSAGLDRVGFNQRKRAASGYFFGPAKLQSMHPLLLTDILRHLPSIRVAGSGRQVRISSSRGVNSMRSVACVQYFLDDMPWQSVTPGDINDFVNGSEVVAVEVYQGAQAPVKYARGLGNCTTIVLWTRFRIPEVTEKQ
jgi:hypothetical protein